MMILTPASKFSLILLLFIGSTEYDRFVTCFMLSIDFVFLVIVCVLYSLTQCL